MSNVLKEVVKRGHEMGLDKAPVVDPVLNEPDQPPPCMTPGQRVTVSHGDVPELRQDDAIVGERRAAGIRGRIDGSPYVSLGGANKGELIQPIREEGTNAVLGIPASRLQAEERLSVARTGYSPRFAAAWEQAFGEKPAEGKWVEVSPGRKRLVR